MVRIGILYRYRLKVLGGDGKVVADDGADCLCYWVRTCLFFILFVTVYIYSGGLSL